MVNSILKPYGNQIDREGWDYFFIHVLTTKNRMPNDNKWHFIRTEKAAYSFLPARFFCIQQ